jgi:hypothetical protein
MELLLQSTRNKEQGTRNKLIIINILICPKILKTGQIANLFYE